MEMDKTNKLKQEIEEYLAKDYCCEFKKECKDGVRIRCSEYEAKLYLILRFALPREKRIAELEEQLSWSKQNYLEADCYEKSLKDKIADLEKENAELKILVSSMLYEINALWDISEMNEDVRKHAERIDSEVEK